MHQFVAIMAKQIKIILSVWRPQTAFKGFACLTPQIVTLSLPSTEWLAVSAKLSITIALFLTYPLQVSQYKYIARNYLSIMMSPSSLPAVRADLDSPAPGGQTQSGQQALGPGRGWGQVRGRGGCYQV